MRVRVDRDEPLLSTAQCRRALGVGETYISAVKRAMGVRGHRLFLSVVKQWLAENPSFREGHVYRRQERASKAPRRSSTRTL
jgi:hypothetical protein